MSASDRLRSPAAACGVLLLAVAAPVEAYGPSGHLIAGRAADDLLCAQAAEEVERLGDGLDLGELGLWADQIRSDPDYDEAAPWHYMNVADDSSVAAFAHPPEGDVLWAIGHFRQRLGDASLTDDARAEALRFLVHFIVDLHQPLHVGRADDRGGNSIDLRFRGESTNLHRLWDTHVIEWTGLTIDDYVDRIRSGVWAPAQAAAMQPVQQWAEESFALRTQVYDFGRENREPSADYMARAADVTGRRLGAAAARLARTLNGIFCER